MVRALNQVTAPSSAIPRLLWARLMDLGFCCGGSCSKEESAMALVAVTTAGNVHSPKHHTEMMFQGELITPLLSPGEAASVLCCPACATPLPWSGRRWRNERWVMAGQQEQAGAWSTQLMRRRGSWAWLVWQRGSQGGSNSSPQLPEGPSEPSLISSASKSPQHNLWWSVGTRRSRWETGDSSCLGGWCRPGTGHRALWGHCPWGFPSFGTTKPGLLWSSAVDSPIPTRMFDRRPPELLSTSSLGILSFIGYEWERCLLTIEPVSFHPFCSRLDVDRALRAALGHVHVQWNPGCQTHIWPTLQARGVAAATTLSWCTSFLDFSLVWSGFSKF